MLFVSLGKAFLGSNIPKMVSKMVHIFGKLLSLDPKLSEKSECDLNNISHIKRRMPPLGGGDAADVGKPDPCEVKFRLRNSNHALAMS